jgi:hypothetical protein
LTKNGNLDRKLNSLQLLLSLLEAAGEYYYDTENVKRWVLGSGGRSGNCEICVDNADRGWISDDDVFEGVSGDLDGPPAHPWCTCTLEYKEKRVRVYL